MYEEAVVGFQDLVEPPLRHISLTGPYLDGFVIARVIQYVPLLVEPVIDVQKQPAQWILLLAP